MIQRSIPHSDFPGRCWRNWYRMLVRIMRIMHGLLQLYSIQCVIEPGIGRWSIKESIVLREVGGASCREKILVNDSRLTAIRRLQKLQNVIQHDLVRRVGFGNRVPEWTCEGVSVETSALGGDTWLWGQ